MENLVYTAVDETGTERLGAALADLLPDGAVVALHGTLGAGKTRLVQAIAVASGVPRRDVQSPTFVLLQEYQGARPIYHFDAYRLRDEDEFLQLGPEEYLEGAGLSLIEWADRVARALPPERLEITIEVAGERARRFTIAARGPHYAAAIAELHNRLSADVVP